MSKISLLVGLVLVFFAFVNVSVAKLEQKDDKFIIKTYELQKGNVSVKVTNLGAKIMSFVLPDKTGKLSDVVLGLDSAEEYKNNVQHLGAILAGVLNSIGQAKFNGTTYTLDANKRNNILKGENIDLSNVTWTVRRKDNYTITFTYTIRDVEGGSHGRLRFTVTYILHGDQSLSVTMSAINTFNKPIPVYLAQNIYWNLGGHNSGDILSNKLQLLASHISKEDYNSSIPTSKNLPVKGTPYDFLKPHVIGSRINKLFNGYDINYVIDDPTGDAKKVAVVRDGKSGRKMELWTNAPNVELYTANRLNVKGKGGYVYKPHAGLVLGTQPYFPSVILNPRKTYKQYVLFNFSTK